mmetsp:Transcript_146262/g.364736  ORF Transcript_146262/g.364736 Transcript_146262/m.364736 type:complete len:218 (-) Transcript_146262:3283-3936(-)
MDTNDSQSPSKPRHGEHPEPTQLLAQMRLRELEEPEMITREGGERGEHLRQCRRVSIEAGSHSRVHGAEAECQVLVCQFLNLVNRELLLLEGPQHVSQANSIKCIDLSINGTEVAHVHLFEKRFAWGKVAFLLEALAQQSACVLCKASHQCFVANACLRKCPCNTRDIPGCHLSHPLCTQCVLSDDAEDVFMRELGIGIVPTEHCQSAAVQFLHIRA